MTLTKTLLLMTLSAGILNNLKVSTNWVRIGFPITITIALGSVVFFEHMRHLTTRRERVKKLKEDCWEPEIEEEDLEMTSLENATEAYHQIPPSKKAAINYPVYSAAGYSLGLYQFFGLVADYILLPITLFLGWFEFGSGSKYTPKWRQKFYHSLIVAGRFVNPFVEWEDKNTTDVFAYFKWQFTRNNRNGNPSDEELDRNLPLMTPNFDLLNTIASKQKLTTASSPRLSESWVVTDKSSPLFSSISSNDEQIMTVTWIGQSTCFIQMDGYNILTDPIFSDGTISNWIGPKRLRPVPCSLSDLPPVNIVLVSHNHYDHLDLSVMKEIGNSATWYVPLGLKKWMSKHGVDRCVELDWWQEYSHDDKLMIVGAPAQHWSGRHFFDVNSTLWASFICKTAQASFFHCGDSGYCTAFKEIGDRYGPISFSALPIGSYEPRYFMQHQHMSPSEAVQVSLDLQSTFALGVHWATFMMSDEHYMDPKREFESAFQMRKAQGCFTLNIGETRVLKL